ncbi:MAG: GYD domain-containing protein [Pseudolabrys sp.]
MPIYISRGRFSSDAVKGMVAKPENREEAVSKLFESVGGKLIGWYLTFGRHDWLVIGEFPDDKACASAYSPLPREAACLISRRPQR